MTQRTNASALASMDVLKVISRMRGDAVVVPTMTSDLEWPLVTTRPDLDVPARGFMSKGSSIALGIALACPNRRVIMLDADGSLLMNLGSLVTIANAGARNLVHFVFENGVYHISGDQPLPAEGKLDFAGLARSAGYRQAYTFDTLPDLEAAIGRILSEHGPTLVCVRVAPISADAKLPDPPPVLASIRRVTETLRCGAS